MEAMSLSSNISNRKPKVVILTWFVSHYRAHVFRRLSQNRNMDFEVWAGNNTEIPGGSKVASAAEVGKLNGIKWHEIKSVRIRGPILHDWEWQSEIVQMAWKRRADVVISGSSTRSLSNILLAIVCRLRGISFIDWGIGVMGPEKWLKWAIRKFYLIWPDAHLLYGQYARDWYASHGFKKESLFVIHNSLEHNKQIAIRESVTPEDIRATRESFGVRGPDDRLIFHTGRLEEKKNLNILLDALKVLKERGKKIKLVLIGGGRSEDLLMTKTRENGVEDAVIFYGVCYEEDILGRIISASDLCVVPGVVGLIAMHSLVYGTPILTRDNSAYKHGPEVDAVVEGKTGRYYRDGDLNDLVEKMDSMLYPVSCKSQMSRACKEMIDKYYTPEYQERVFIQAVNYVLPPEKRIPVPD
jgi:glycosyltransferase involved in cell wall biosynthesis